MESQEDLVPTIVVEPPSVLRWRTMVAVPLAAAFAFGLHMLIAKSEAPLETHSYRLLFAEIIGVSIVLALLRRFSPGLRRWMANMWPIFTRSHRNSLRLGRDHARTPNPSAPVFSRPVSRAAKFDQ